MPGLRLALAAVCLMAFVEAQAPSVDLTQQALTAWKSYDYPKAEQLFREAIANGNSPEAHAGLVRTFLSERKFSAAQDAIREALRLSPNSAAVQAAHGDVLFRAAKVEEAEAAYRQALDKDPKLARGWYGLSQVAQINSFYLSSKRAILKAHELDPEDPEIYDSWASRLPRAERKRAVEHMVDHHGQMDAERLNILQSRLAWLIVLGNKTAWQLVSTNETAKLKLEQVVRSSTSGSARMAPTPKSGGVAVRVRFNDKKTVSLLLDTGSSGIVLRKNAAGKADLKSVYDIATKGLGDEKPTNGYLGWARDVKIGPIEFANVPVTVLDGDFAGGTDGLIGIDVFEHFLITLDIKNSELALAPLPALPADHRDEEGTSDRYIAPEMKDFQPVLHMGPHILVPTSVDQQPSGLFFLDTGAFDTQVDPAYVSKSKLSAAPHLGVRGLSGNVRDVFVANNVHIQFGRFVQDNFRLIAISMDRLSEGEGIALSGILGFPLLSQFRLTIDYRDGLVNFDYLGKR